MSAWLCWRGDSAAGAVVMATEHGHTRATEALQAHGHS
jgi:hypothetical protein